jgi:hypothetical protein
MLVHTGLGCAVDASQAAFATQAQLRCAACFYLESRIRLIPFLYKHSCNKQCH